MSFIDKLISSVAPHDCLGCGYEGQLVCAECAVGISPVPERCYRCHKASLGSVTCQNCCQVSNLGWVQATTPYTELAKELVWRLKFHGTQAAVKVMARHMATLLTNAPDSLTGSAVLVPVPTATSRTRSRGYDQAKLLARELAQRADLHYIDCLRRRGQTHQVGSSRGQRLEQLQQAFWVKSSGSLFTDAGTIILVDDVLTTGATLEMAATALKQASFKDVYAIVFTQA